MSDATSDLPQDDAASRRIAYFSMEVGIDERLPIYSGGLGVLAADTLRTFADLKIPAVGVTLLYAKGFFRQVLDADGSQHEEPVEWNPADILQPLDPTAEVSIEGRIVRLRAWRYDIAGVTGHHVPLILLDTRAADNDPSDQAITDQLYAGDERHRLCQEIVLGIGGVRMLKALGFTRLRRFHMNEGHASLLALELLAEEPDPAAPDHGVAAVRRRCVFTTHTPVPAGHDQFPYALVEEVLGEPIPRAELEILAGPNALNMTQLGLTLSHYVNGVAKRHGEVSQKMFPGYAIDSVTNGIHSFTWTCGAFRRLFDLHVPGWARDPFSLRYAIKIPPDEVWEAHAEAKWRLLKEIEARTSQRLSIDALTIGFARRSTTYKRPLLIFTDPERLADISRRVGRLQIVFAGKAHPRDEPGKELIREIHRVAERLRSDVSILYLPDYGIELARHLTSGVDLWLNTPLRPLEASGTSGMKAAVNGVPSFSVLDGWWIEGHIEGMTGWSIGPGPHDEGEESPDGDRYDAQELYEKLDSVIAPLYYRSRPLWINVMRRAIAFNASFFNTHRMVEQYAANAYL